MNILIVGCGKVGSELAMVLSEEGHDVSVVSKEESALDLLDNDFRGYQTCGIPIDQDVLRRAGIESCDALAAVSSDDNVNIMVSQLAQKIFNVPKVIARIYDPRREDVFSHFGLHTVCPTNITVAAVRSAITDNEQPKTINIGSSTISFTTEILPKALIGANAGDIDLEKNQSLYAVLHTDLTLTLYQGQKLKLASGDKIIISHIID